MKKFLESIKQKRLKTCGELTECLKPLKTEKAVFSGVKILLQSALPYLGVQK